MSNYANELFLIFLAGLFALLFAWGFRRLPAEGWQMIASVPMHKDERGEWRGLNLTFYGVFVATACAFGLLTIIVLMSSIGASLAGVGIAVALLLSVCMPAAKIVAAVVERKRHTFTVGGAAFVGILIAPLVVWTINEFAAPRVGFNQLPSAPFFAALAVAYAFSEAFGRLACISFGCCYGKPLAQTPPALRELFRRYHFVFTGETKKVAYEGALAGEPVLPIQAITAVIFTLAGLVGSWLFLKSYWVASSLVALLTTQAWRVLSEFVRADFRGSFAGGKLTIYQLMGILAIIYALALPPFVNSSPQIFAPDITQGLTALGKAQVLIALQALWLFAFLRTGRSSVTGARLSFHVIRERV